MHKKISGSKLKSKFLGTGLAMVLMGAAAAHADELTVQQRAQLEMNAGKDYVAAWAAATHAAAAANRAAARDDGDAEVARQRRVVAALNAGKDYSAAWGQRSHSTAAVHSAEQIAIARRVQEELGQGKDYVTALATAEKAARAQAPADGQVTMQAGARDGSSAMK